MLEGVLDGNNEANSHYLDAADEEVHFSRFHQLHLGPFATAAAAHPTSSSSSSSNSYLPLHHQDSLDSATGGGVSFTNINLDQHEPHQNDQLKSSRLLTCLGSKLRRSSNYYLAAPKLLSQYLLGITIRSWFEFLDTSRLVKAPSNAQQLTRRLVANLNHFQGNYLCVSLVLIIYCILTSPLLLLAIVAYLVSLYAITVRTATGRHFRIANFRPNLQQQYSFVTLISLPLLWVAGAPSAVFWVIGASFVVVGLHASMYSQHRLEQTAVGAAGEILPVRLNGSQKQALVAHRLSVPNFQPQPAAAPTNHANYYSHCGQSLNLANNHHRQQQQQQQQQYLPIPGSSQAGKQSEQNNRYTSALVQWISFGSSSSSSASNLKREESGKVGDQLRQVSDVTIISQDYAGLGRVYEI